MSGEVQAALRRCAYQCHLAEKAFSENWAIDWDEVRNACTEAEALIGPVYDRPEPSAPEETAMSGDWVQKLYEAESYVPTNAPVWHERELMWRRNTDGSVEPVGYVIRDGDRWVLTPDGPEAPAPDFDKASVPEEMRNKA